MSATDDSHGELALALQNLRLDVASCSRVSVLFSGDQMIEAEALGLAHDPTHIVEFTSH